MNKIFVSHGWSLVILPGWKIIENEDNTQFLGTPKIGAMEITSYSKGEENFSQSYLENFLKKAEITNAELATCGNFSGVFYPFEEEGFCFRKWFVFNESTLLEITYTVENKRKEEEIEKVNLLLMGLSSSNNNGNSFLKEEKDLTKEELRTLSNWADSGGNIVSKYFPKIEINSLKPDDLDFVFQSWKADQSPEKPNTKEIIDGLGALFGELLQNTFTMKWKEVSDYFGTAKSLVRENGSKVFPFAFVEKRTKSGNDEHSFFSPLFQHLKEEDA